MNSRHSLTAALCAFAAGCAPAARAPTVLPPIPRSVTAAAPAAPTPEFARTAFISAVDSLLAQPEFRTTTWGALIVDVDRGDTIYSHNAHKVLVPASNQKILTGAVALAQLGPDYRFRTTFAARCSADRSSCSELVVIGRGDPTVSARFHSDPLIPLRAVADSLLARGISGFTGPVVAAGDAFPGAIHGFGWEWDDLTEDYGAGIDELMFNEGLEAIEVQTPSGLTVLSENPAADPSSAYLRALSVALRQRGIQHRGTLRTDTAASSSPLDTLFVLHSPPLRDILGPFLKPSQNQLGEILLRAIALERTGIGRADSGAAVMTRQLREWGVDSMGFEIADGSGLSRHNFVSPATIVRVLSVMRGHPDNDVFYNALPAVGVDGTVRAWLPGTTAAGNAHGKTGTLGAVRAFSGYVRTATGATLIYSFLCNNYLVPTSKVTAAIQEIVRRMADLSFPGT